ncbi:MAG: hypothetical protein ACRDNZ_14220 [Streptosporangiaceae bacterium]
MGDRDILESSRAVSVGRNRFDETWHRLREWTGGQTKSEMLAWQVIAADGYTRIDPSHPHGGPDGGRDAMCERDAKTWVMAVYFPLGQKTRATIKKKLLHDMEGAKARGAAGTAFVTNQEISLADREEWEQLDPELKVDLFHLLRVTQILNEPEYARTREEFLDIVAGPPPMLIEASVIGTAHGFSEDTEMLDCFVEMYEKQVRDKSDEGHARARAEREAKHRAEREKRAREAAEKARKEAMDVFPTRPREVGFDMPWISDLLGPSRFVDSFKFDTPRLLPAHLAGMGDQPKPPEPVSEEQIQEKVARYRAGLESRWSACMDYLAGIAWPGQRFRIKNEAKSFLTDVQVILTFHGARGIDFEEISDFELEKVQDPAWEPPSDPRFGTVALPVQPLRRSSDFPIEWRHNEDGDLEVTVTLERLRPHPEWRSDDYSEEIVLVVNADIEIDEIVVTYTATAHGYGDVFQGKPIIVPVERVPMLDVLHDVIEATREAS